MRRESNGILRLKSALFSLYNIAISFLQLIMNFLLVRPVAGSTVARDVIAILIKSTLNLACLLKVLVLIEIDFIDVLAVIYKPSDLQPEDISREVKQKQKKPAHFWLALEMLFLIQRKIDKSKKAKDKT